MSVPRKRRKNKVITRSNELFSKYMDEKNYKSASDVVYVTALIIGGKRGLMNAMNNAISFMERRTMRLYLD